MSNKLLKGATLKDTIFIDSKNYIICKKKFKDTKCNCKYYDKCTKLLKTSNSNNGYESILYILILTLLLSILVFKP